MSMSMNPQPNIAPVSPLDAQTIAPAVASSTRPFYWSVRRELWENRSIYVAPLAIAAVYLLGFMISLIWLPKTMRELPAKEPVHRAIELAMPYAHASMLLLLTAFLVGIFYSLDALHGERRDRSILFWKSLPVSDLTTVLSKAFIPLVVLPVVVLVIVTALQLVMFVMSTIVLLMTGAGVGTLWQLLPLFQMELVLLYSVIVVALWHAPIYCWLLLISGWARRAAFLWAVLPPLALSAVEFIGFRSHHVLGLLLQDRLFGFASGAFDLVEQNGVKVDAHLIPLSRLAPGKFLTSPGLWFGLIFAAIFLAAAVRLRRYREPI